MFGLTKNRKEMTMKTFNTVFLFLLFQVSLFAQTGQVEVTIKNVTPEWGGTLSVGLYREDTFPREGQALFSQIIPVRTLEHQVVFQDVDPGKYAIAVYQDLDSNGKLNRNFYGDPQEPYGFSNNKYGRFGPPKFADVSFLVGEELSTSLAILIE
jgi:uncharacterized protein (DUF2141 family)